MLRPCFRFSHKVRDVGGNAHNFAFDTMTKVYRDAVYAKDAQDCWNPVLQKGEGSSRRSAAVAAAPASSAAVGPRLLAGLEQKGTGAGGGENVIGLFPAGVQRVSRRSGVQVEILGLYRAMLKETQRLEDRHTRESLRQFIRAEFGKNRNISRRFVTRIEWQIHHGRNKLEELRSLRSNARFSLVQ